MQFEKVKKGDHKQQKRNFMQNHTFYAKEKHFLQKERKKYCAKVNLSGEKMIKV